MNTPDIQCTYKTKEGKIVNVLIPWDNPELNSKVVNYELPEGAIFLSSIPSQDIPTHNDK